MSFERTFIAASYAMVGVAFLAVALSGELGWVAPALFGAAFVVSAALPVGREPSPVTAQIWTVLLFVAFGALFAWAWYDGNWLLHALQFALLMTISRLFQRRFAKDYLQLYALSFLLMLVAAVIHPSLTFAVCFLAYAVLAIWGLTFVHLVREIEVQTHTGPEHLLPPEAQVTAWLPWNWRRKPPEPEPDTLPESPVSPENLLWRRRRLIRGSFLAASSAMALGVLGVSMVFFFLFPRLGMGFFMARTRGSQAVVGFSDEVQLGGFGKLKTSAQVVMRVTFPENPERLERSLRVRGVSFDRYDTLTHSWQRMDDPISVLLNHGDRYSVPRTPGPRAGHERTFSARFYMEPLSASNKVLFAPPRPLWVEFVDSQYDGLRGRRKRVAQTLGGDLSYRAPPDTALVYRVSAVEPIGQAELGKLLITTSGRIPRWIRDRWTALPADLDPRIGKLADELIGPEKGLYRAATKVESALQRRWTYSLDGGHDPKAPLADFLFGIKKGHCEYFATAMVLLLRSRGHAARLVNGFVGGEYNAFGNYRMIRQGDAHSWVEVYFPGLGWHTFDPTPPAGQLAPPSDGALAGIRRMIDGASMLWYTWVVEYDLERQVSVFRKVGQAMRKLGGGLKLSSSSHSQRRDTPQRDDEQASKIGAAVLRGLPYLMAVLALVWLARFAMLRRRERDDGGVDRRITAAVTRLNRSLRRHGLERQRWETWHLVAKRIADHDPAVGALLGVFARAYDRARYAQDHDESSVLAAVTAAQQAEAAVKTMPAPDVEQAA